MGIPRRCPRSRPAGHLPRRPARMLPPGATARPAPPPTCPIGRRTEGSAGQWPARASPAPARVGRGVACRRPRPRPAGRPAHPRARAPPRGRRVLTPTLKHGQYPTLGRPNTAQRRHSCHRDLESANQSAPTSRGPPPPYPPRCPPRAPRWPPPPDRAGRVWLRARAAPLVDLARRGGCAPRPPPPPSSGAPPAAPPTPPAPAGRVHCGPGRRAGEPRTPLCALRRALPTLPPTRPAAAASAVAARAEELVFHPHPSPRSTVPPPAPPRPRPPLRAPPLPHFPAALSHLAPLPHHVSAVRFSDKRPYSA